MQDLRQGPNSGATEEFMRELDMAAPDSFLAPQGLPAAQHFGLRNCFWNCLVWMQIPFLPWLGCYTAFTAFLRGHL